MTREEILDKNSGPLLDALIAETVLGWQAWEEKRGGYHLVIFQKPGEKEPYKSYQNPEAEKIRYQEIEVSQINYTKHIVCGLKDFSTDITAALEAVEEIKPIPFGIHRTHTGWAVNWCISNYACDDCDAECTGESEVKSKSLPETICKALLLIKYEAD